jgi:hypothetical protein
VGDHFSHRLSSSKSRVRVMHKLLGTIMVMSMIFIPESFAQTLGANSTSGSNAGATSTSGNEVGSSSLNANVNSRSLSASGSTSSSNSIGATGGYAGVDATINNVTSPAATASSGGNPASNENVHYSGSQTVNNVPDQAALIESPTAPCMVPIGATFSVAGFGGGAVGAYTSKTCETLERVRMTWNMNQPDVATMMMCQFSDYRNARAAVGKPCPDPSATVASADPPMATAATDPPSRSYIAPIQTASVQIATATQPSEPSPLTQFCSSLNPNNPEDAPYLATECARP